MQLDEKSYILPKIVASKLKDIYKVNLWVYKGKRYSSWHYDGHDNFLYVLKGQKTLFLAHPAALPSQSIFSTFNNHLKKDFKAGGKWKGTILKAIVYEGQCLFIPKGWWHAVASSGSLNIAANFWGNSILQNIHDLGPIDKLLVLKELTLQTLDTTIRKTFNFSEDQWTTIDEILKEALR